MANRLDALAKKLAAIKQELEKARRPMSDEHDVNDAAYDDTDHDMDDLNEFDPDSEESAGEDWLKENDPEKKGGVYDEYGDGEDEDAHQKGIEEDLGNDEAPEEVVEPAAAAAQADQPGQEAQREEVPKKKSRFNQPSREELTSHRAYTRPWEQRARETQALKADPSKNPELARHGNIIEARNAAHGDRKSAYNALTSSDQYKNADPIQQMEMDDNFEKEFSAKNPEHLKNALAAHSEAHAKGKGNRDAHAAAKDAQIRNIISGGGHGGEGYSAEEGMQHAGGVRGESGTQATVKQDPASSFAMGNQDFINQYAKDYEKKGKKASNVDDIGQFNEGSKRDLNRILGEAHAKDPKFEKFFEHYHPLIGMNAKKTLNRLGLDPNHPEIDHSMLHEAGMHGLIQAVNDYDHDNPGKASFATHAANKIRGLQMTAMKNQDAIPSEVRQAQKKFNASNTAGAPQSAPKVDIHKVIGHPANPKAADMSDRLKRISAAREAHNTVKVRKAPVGGGGQTSGQGGGL
jgi:hypothetical protein